MSATVPGEVYRWHPINAASDDETLVVARFGETLALQLVPSDGREIPVSELMDELLNEVFLLATDSGASGKHRHREAEPEATAGRHVGSYNAGLEVAARLVCPDPHVEEQRDCRAVAKAIRALKAGE